LKSPAKYNLFADYFQSHTQDFAQPLHRYWKLWQSRDVTGGVAPPLPDLGALPAAATACGPRWTARGPPMLLLLVVVVVFPLPNLLENPKPLARLSLLSA
jgi:hypothetical protein